MLSGVKDDIVPKEHLIPRFWETLIANREVPIIINGSEYKTGLGLERGKYTEFESVIVLFFTGFLILWVMFKFNLCFV